MSGPRPTFAGYRLLDIITTDAVSTVYRATRSDGAPDVVPIALRVTHAVDTATTSAAEQITAFLHKASVAGRLRHPAIARTLDVGQAEERAYVATEFTGGTTLGDLTAQGPLPPAAALALLRDVAYGLDTAHRHHVIHGAVGPHTIWVTPQDDRQRSPRASIVGFGLDTLLRQQSRADRDSAASDDLLYVAPEQLRGRQLDSRVDQYALACALYHCVVGQPPFVRDSAAALFGAHLFASPSLQMPVFHDGPQLRRAVVRGLAKEPLDRYPSCLHLIQDAVPGPETHAAAVPVTTSPAAAIGATQAPAPPASGEPHPVTVSDDLRPGLPRGSRQRTASRWRHRWWYPWPAATLLLGLVVTLAIASRPRDNAVPDVAVAGSRQEEPSPQPTRPLDVAVASASASASPAPQTEVAWEQTVGQEPVGDLAVVGDAVVATTDNGVVTLDARQGTPRWQGAVDVGILTDMVATDDLVVYRGASLRALSVREGQERWDNESDLAPTGSLAATSDIIYGMGPGRIVPELMAVDPATGDELWHFHGEEVTVDQRAAVAPTDDLVAILQTGSLFGLDPRGELASSGADRVEVDEESWRADITAPWVQSLIFPEGGDVIFGTQDGRICAHDPANGTQSWCAEIAALRNAEPRLLAEGDTIVVVTAAGVVALDLTTGEQHWSFDAPESLRAVADVTAQDVIVADTTGGVQALALDSGVSRWRSAVVGGDITALAATEGNVFVGAQDGSVVCVRPVADAD